MRLRQLRPARIVGKALIGLPGQTVVIDASDADYGVLLDENATLANVAIVDAQDTGVLLFNNATSDGSASNTLIYRVSVGSSGLSPSVQNDNGGGLLLTQGAAHNCIVSTEAYDSWNEVGAPNDHGGNSDGYKLTFGAHDNAVIDSHTYRNGDDGFDTWMGGSAYFYFSVAHDGGKTQGKYVSGDGPNQSTGNGNGFKMGPGPGGVGGEGATHHLYKCAAHDNIGLGFDINGNSNPAQLVEWQSFSNGGADWFD